MYNRYCTHTILQLYVLMKNCAPVCVSGFGNLPSAGGAFALFTHRRAFPSCFHEVIAMAALESFGRLLSWLFACFPHAPRRSQIAYTTSTTPCSPHPTLSGSLVFLPCCHFTASALPVVRIAVRLMVARTV